MNISVRKSMSKWLQQFESDIDKKYICPYHNITFNTKLTPDNIRMETIDKEISLFMRTMVDIRNIQVFQWSITSKLIIRAIAFTLVQ
jgi:hypothetical protein